MTPNGQSSELDNLPMASARPSEIREAAKASRIAAISKTGQNEDKPILRKSKKSGACELDQLPMASAKPSEIMDAAKANRRAAKGIKKSVRIQPEPAKKSELESLPLASAKPSEIMEAAKANRRASKAEKERKEGNVAKLPKRACELDDLPMKSAKPSAIREAAKAARLANKAEREKIKERQSREAAQLMRMQKYRDEIAAIKKKQEAEDGTEVKSVSNIPEKQLAKEVTAKDENKVLGYSSDEDSIDLEETTKAKVKQSGRNLMKEMNKSFRSFENLQKPSSSTPGVMQANKQNASINLAAMTLSSAPPRPARTRTANKTAPRRHASNLVPEMRRKPMQRDLLFDEEQMKRDRATVYRTSGNRGTNPKRTKSVAAKVEKEKEEVKEQRKKLDEAEESFTKGHNLCWKFQDSSNACKIFLIAYLIEDYSCLYPDNTFVSNCLQWVSTERLYLFVNHCWENIMSKLGEHIFGSASLSTNWERYLRH